MTNIDVEKLRETASDLQNIKNGIGTNSNNVKLAAFFTLSEINKLIHFLEKEE